MTDWEKCEHEWVEVDNHGGHEPAWICKKCNCPGAGPEGDVYWPAT